MDPSSKAQEQHARMHADLLAKGKRIAALEAELSAAGARAAEAERRMQAEARRAAQVLQEKDVQLASRVAELDAREEVLADAQEECTAAQAKAEAESEAARKAVAEAESRAREAEAARMALQRERDAALASNATDLQAYHEQLIALSKNHLERQNDDIARLAKLKSEKEEIKTPVTMALQEKLAEAERKLNDLQQKFETEIAAVQEQLRQTTVRAEEDAARHAAQRAELEATLAAERTDLAETSRRVTESAAEEVARLQAEVSANARLASSLTSWESRRAASEASWLSTKDEHALALKELQQSRARIEGMEHAHAQSMQLAKRDTEALRQKLSECETQLTKKTKALNIYHEEIKRNGAKMAELARAQQASEKAHRAEQERAAQMVAAAQKAAGKPVTPGQAGSSQNSLGGAISSLFRSGNKDAAQAGRSPVPAAGSSTRTLSDADSEGESFQGPKRSLSSADGDEATVNALHEEMAVSLSKRVESLEDERLTLTSQLEALKKRAQNQQVLNQLLHAKLGNNPAATADPALRAALKAAGHTENGGVVASFTDGAGSSSAAAAPAPKKSLLGGLLGGGSKGKDASAAASMNDPAHVRSLLEEATLSNQSLSIESEKSAAELKRLKLLLEGARAERDEAVAREKIMAAQVGAKSKSSSRKSGATGAPEASAASSSSSSSGSAVAQ
jgi:hypothetical protein